MWLRSSLAYPWSFWLTTAGNLVVTFLDFVVLAVMFTHVQRLGGWSLPEVAFLYGTSAICLGLADLTVGSLDQVGERVRDGSLDTVLLRPAPALAQLAADRMAPRRLGRVLQGAGVLAWSLVSLRIDWTWGRVAMVPLLVVAGTVIFGAVFVAAAGFQIVVPGAAEAQNALTFGGSTLLQYPPTVYGRDLVRGVLYGVPLGFANWVPAAYVLGRPLPEGLPGWLRFASPAVAALFAALAALCWRAGLRAYRSTGS
nr:ABC-2 family transporter protein [Phaeacidiphilus oryzae]